MGLFLISDIKGLCFGAEDVKAVYIGSEQVWPVGSLPEWIEFADPEVLRVLLANGVDTDGDGGITKEEAAAVTSIGSWFDKNSTIQFFNEFKEFTKVTSLRDSSNVTINGVNAFSKCTSLQEITLPSSLTRIGSYAFSGCSSLEKINIDEHITYIGLNAFEKCANIKNELFMPNLTTLGRGAFKGSGIVSFESTFSGDIAGVDSTLGGTFSDCVHLEKVIIPNVGNIQPRAFYNDTNLKELDITNVENILQNAFRGCISLNVDLNLPNLTTVGNYAFIDTKIKSLNAPKLISIAGVDNTIGGAFANIEEIVSVYIPSIKSIGPRAFWNCSNLTQISEMENLETLGDRAFYECTSLAIEDLNLPNLESLGQNAFYGVKIKKLVLGKEGGTLTLPAGSSSTQNYGDKSVLEEIVLHEVTSVPERSFYGYDSTSIAIPDSVTSIGNESFRNAGVKSVQLPNLTTLGRGAFAQSSVEVVENLGSISSLLAYSGTYNGVFQSCASLKKVVLPETITSIGQWSFIGCKALEALICNAVIPPTIDREPFSNTNSTFIIYVPDATVEAYKTATNWSSYADRIKPLSEYDGELPDIPQTPTYENITSNYTLEVGQAYGQVGGTIQFTDDIAYEHTKALIGDVSYVMVKAPSQASSLVQYVNENDTILKIAITDFPSTLTRYYIENIEGATHIYVTSATGTMELWKEVIE